MRKTLLFVYGTLKIGFGLSQYLQHQRYLGIGYLRAEQFVMYALAGHPALVRKEGQYPIYGELYEVLEESLPKIDEVEGTAHNLYAREKVELESYTLAQLPLSNNTFEMLRNKQTDAYVYKQSVEGARDCKGFWGKS